jgi:hypothetical protein
VIAVLCRGGGAGCVLLTLPLQKFPTLYSSEYIKWAAVDVTLFHSVAMSFVIIEQDNKILDIDISPKECVLEMMLKRLNVSLSNY